jgi:dihydroorotate dehydrogenase
MSIYRTLIRPLLFSLDPESAHRLTLQVGKAARAGGVAAVLRQIYGFESPRLTQSCFGLQFKNPVGLAAGIDKNCEASELFTSLGFGFLESVACTYQAQPGNPTPRVFRIPEHNALINRMGFPSLGAEALAPRIEQARAYANSRGVIFGVNIGKSKSVEIENAVEDYLKSFRLLRSKVDFVTLNVSSPNTPRLRELQSRSHLAEIISAVQAENTTAIPILVKVAPDLELSHLDEIIDVCLEQGVRGIIATNTTVSRDGIPGPIRDEAGGLSGVPLFKLSVPFVRHIRQRVGNQLSIIGVGGISSAHDAITMFTAGADLIQIYTGLVYQGPRLVYEIKRGLLEYLDSVGAASITEIVGEERELSSVLRRKSS